MHKWRTQINGLTRYPAYKDSGVTWLREIPAHWDARQLKHFATVNDETLAESTDPGFVMHYVDIGSVDAFDGIIHQETLAFGNAPSRARRVVRHGDVIVSTVRTYLRAIASIEDPAPNTIVSTGFAVVRPREMVGNFAAYALRAPYFVERVVANSVGVSYPAINAEDLVSFEIAIPPLSEQRGIAAFLDRETAKIDALVAKKEQLIELLQEKRSALISHAVTRGLDPDVPVKDTGVAQLGEIPAHWSVKRLKHLSCITSGLAVPGSFDKHYGERPVYGSNGRIGYCNDYVIDKECFVIGRVGSSGSINLAPAYSWVSDNALICMPYDASQTSWLLYVLMFSELGKQATKNAQPLITATFVADSAIAIPTRAEQHAIAVFLDRETAKIDALIDKVRDAIDRLKELRTALISAAVTGKIDVRQAAA